jgi:hypothetical protein
VNLGKKVALGPNDVLQMPVAPLVVPKFAARFAKSLTLATPAAQQPRLAPFLGDD